MMPGPLNLIVVFSKPLEAEIPQPESKNCILISMPLISNAFFGIGRFRLYEFRSSSVARP